MNNDQYIKRLSHIALLVVVNLSIISIGMAAVKFKQVPLPTEYDAAIAASFLPKAIIYKPQTKMAVDNRSLLFRDNLQPPIIQPRSNEITGIVDIVNQNLNNVIFSSANAFIWDSQLSNVIFHGTNASIWDSQLSNVIFRDTNASIWDSQLSNVTLINNSTVHIGSNTSLSGTIKVDDGLLIFYDNPISTSDTLYDIAANNMYIGLYISSTDSIDLANVKLSGGKISLYNNGSSFNQLTMTTLQGSGLFYMSSDLSNQLSHKINVSGKASGEFNVYLTDTGQEPEKNASLVLINVGDGSEAQFTLGGSNQTIDIGTYQYTLKTWNNQKWHLVPVGTTIDPDPTPAPPTPGPEPTANPVLSRSAQAVIDSSVTTPTVIQNTVNTIQNQLDNQGDGVAGSAMIGSGGGNVLAMGAGSSRIKVNNNDNINFNQDIQVVMLSYGKTIELEDDNLLTLGIYAGNSDADLDLKGNGTGKVMSYSVAGYTKYKHASGFHAEAILTFNYSKNNTYVHMSSGGGANSKYHLFGSGLALRVSQDFKLPILTLQPYIGLRGISVGKHTYHMSNGMKAQLNESRSLVSSWGVKAKRKFAFDPLTFEAYMSVTNEREFIDNNRVRINGNKFTSDLSGSWFTYSVGVKAPIYRDFLLNFSYDMMHGKHVKSPGEFGLQLEYGF